MRKELVGKFNRAAGRLGERLVTRSQTNGSQNSNSQTANLFESPHPNGNGSVSTQSSQDVSQNSSSPLTHTGLNSQSLRLVVDEDHIEQDRDFTLQLTVNTFGKLEHVEKAAFAMLKHLYLNFDIVDARLDGEWIEHDHARIRERKC